MGREDEFDKMDPKKAKESIECIAEYFETNNLIDIGIFRKILQEGNTKNDYTGITFKLCISFIRKLDNHLTNSVVWKNEFYDYVEEFLGYQKQFNDL